MNPQNNAPHQKPLDWGNTATSSSQEEKESGRKNTGNLIFQINKQDVKKTNYFIIQAIASELAFKIHEKRTKYRKNKKMFITFAFLKNPLYPLDN